MTENEEAKRTAEEELLYDALGDSLTVADWFRPYDHTPHEVRTDGTIDLRQLVELLKKRGITFPGT